MLPEGSCSPRPHGTSLQGCELSRRGGPETGNLLAAIRTRAGGGGGLSARCLSQVMKCSQIGCRHWFRQLRCQLRGSPPFLEPLGSLPGSSSWLHPPACIDHGRQQVIAQEFEFLLPLGETWVEFLAPSFSLLSPDITGKWGENQQMAVYLCLLVSASQFFQGK